MKPNSINHLKKRSFEQLFALVQDGQIPLSIVLWNKHMSRFEGCVCETKMLDRTLCGFCLLSRLQSQGLSQSSPETTAPYLDAAQSISCYLGLQRNAGARLAAE
ncbi:hypothetical protein BEN30_03810 [Magnetovibrio blakemorei]|uniref:Uncharacterized protein n=2 Tax=Magnetovibrio blakemorei TaxID=28181 RepID=A0A1E5QB15_9PROT|nr:hypothetical protein BEN30_03810 [Magnetovibrio blakemorei]